MTRKIGRGVAKEPIATMKPTGADVLYANLVKLRKRHKGDKTYYEITIPKRVTELLKLSRIEKLKMRVESGMIILEP